MKMTRINNNTHKIDSMKYLGVTLDKKMTGCLHFEKAAGKGRRRLKLLQRLAGVSCGAKLDTLALTYTSYIRPSIEYGSEIFPLPQPSTRIKLTKSKIKPSDSSLGQSKPPISTPWRSTPKLSPCSCGKNNKPSVCTRSCRASNQTTGAAQLPTGEEK
jgi:hypothetical protein